MSVHHHHHHHHHRHQYPPPSIPPAMQTRSSARSTLSPDIARASPASRHPYNRPRVHNRSSRGPAARVAIDLTESSPLRPGSDSNSPTPPPSNQEARYISKRRKSPHIQEVDLIENDEIRENELRRRQREDLLKTQEAARESEKRKVAGFTCVICMEDEPTDLAVTPCGHMFCHKCLHGAIKASAMPPNKQNGRCPVCRGKVSLKDVVPMEFKVLSKSQGKQKAL